MKLTRKNFGKILKKIRIEKKLSRDDLGKILGMKSGRTVEHWENGRMPARGIVEFYNFMKGTENHEK